jgi:glycosyltransferase involved in cell wall biosynthesis
LKGIPIDKLHFSYNPEESNIEELPVKVPKKFSKDLKILILGNLGIYKGLEVLNCLLNKIDEQDIQNLIFYHIGGVSEGSLSNHIIKFGWLEKNERIDTIKAIDADLALVPAQCPETYSVIISDLLRLQIPILASKVGAIPERLLNRKYSKLVDDYSNPESWLEGIIEFRDNQFNNECVKLDYTDSQKDLILVKRNRYQDL